MMRRISAWLLLLLLVAVACNPGGTDAAPAGGAAVPDVADGSTSLTDLLDWERAPDAVVVRLDTVGTSGSTADDLNSIPFCTLFGDGHLVWLDPFADPEQVLEDRLDDGEIRRFIEYVIGLGFYSWSEETGFSPPTVEPQEGPLVEQLSVNLYGDDRSLTSLSDWPTEAFANILERCRALGTEPVLYVPRGGAWLSTVPVEMRRDVPSLPWSVYTDAFPEVDLAAIGVENPLWVTGDLAQSMWDIARAGRMQVTHEGQAYRIAMQVPVIQPDAPPAPAE